MNQLCKQSGLLGNQDQAVAAQTHSASSLCLPRMCYYVEQRHRQAIAVHRSTGQVAKKNCFACSDLSDHSPLLRSEENKKINPENTGLELQAKPFAHKNMCSC